MTPRQAVIRDSVRRVHASGVKPTSRGVLAELAGKTVKAFPQGMGGNDLLHFRSAMIELGYTQGKYGRWQPPAPVGLDEVECSGTDWSICPILTKHTLADHAL